MINNLQKLRIEHGETQRDLAKLLGLKTSGAYCKKELGYTPITLQEAYIIAVHFKTTIESIFFAN